MAEFSISEWKAFLAKHPRAHLLQTGEWGELKSAFGWQTRRVVAGDCGAQILFRKLPLGLTLAYIPKGPLIGESVSGIRHQFWSEVDRTCHSCHAVFLKVEPDNWEAQGLPLPANNQSFISSMYNIQPRRTLIVSLRGSEQEILARMKQKCRYNIRLAGKKGVTVRPWDDVESFHRMMLVTGERDAFGVHSLEYYRRAYHLLHPAGLAELLVAEFDGKPLAGLMVACRGNRAWYLYGASTDEARNLMPTYLLQWEAMRWARAHGAEEYDLWGAPDEDEPVLEAGFESRSDGLWGVYRFKRGFGGKVVRLAQAMDKVYHPLLYQLYLRRMAGREAS